jgi:hypothetical protein
VSALADSPPSVADSPLLALLAESALAVERLAASERHRGSANTKTSRRALLTIELRLKFEEQVLLPRFRELGLPAEDTVEKQIELLRELLAQAAQGELALQGTRLLWAAIERMSILHFDAMAQLMLLALADSAFDADAAWREAEDCRSRWRDEIAESGDIEDEEADPVGQPPR